MNIAPNVQSSISITDSSPDIDNKGSPFFYSTQSKTEVRKLQNLLINVCKYQSFDNTYKMEIKTIYLLLCQII